MSEIAYFEGQFVPIEEANVSIKNHSFLYGTSIFEGIRGYWLPELGSASVFRLREHLERILSNSRIFFMTPEQSLDELMDLTTELVRKNAHETDFYIRFTLFKNGISIGPYLDKVKTDVCIWTNPLGDYVNINDGLHVTVSSWRRV
ncbi:MAG TPA: hypothetical protein VN132_09000, partial [Bdellovibrio sp.]|nr:hypothetical protein [Bdellovibrio sp.]